MEICKGSRDLTSGLVHNHFHHILWAEARQKISTDSRGGKIDYASLVRGTARSHGNGHEHKGGMKNRSQHCNFPLYVLLSSSSL